jgi:hypothetical protein
MNFLFYFDVSIYLVLVGLSAMPKLFSILARTTARCVPNIVWLRGFGLDRLVKVGETTRDGWEILAARGRVRQLIASGHWDEPWTRMGA